MRTIEEIALEEAKEIGKSYLCEDGKYVLDPVEFATRFLARVDQERGKNAVATFTAIAFDFPQVSWHANAFNMKQGGMLFRSPTIPSGITKSRASFDAAYNAEGKQIVFPKVTVWFAEDDWKSRDKFEAMIQAAGVTK